MRATLVHLYVEARDTIKPNCCSDFEIALGPLVAWVGANGVECLLRILASES